jgi:hypothetical protein
MTNPDPFRTYLDELRHKLATGIAKEHALTRASWVRECNS